MILVSLSGPSDDTIASALRIRQRAGLGDDDRPVGRRVTAEEQGNAHDSVVSRQPHLGGRAVFHGMKQGHDGIGREVDVLQVATRLVYDLAQSSTVQTASLGAGTVFPCRSPP